MHIFSDLLPSVRFQGLAVGLVTGLVAGLVLGGAAILSASAQPPADIGVTQQIEQLRVAYHDRLADLRRRHQAADAQWLSLYGEALDRFTRDAQDRGDFRAWQSGLREQERLQQSEDLSADHRVFEPAALRALQQRTIDARERQRYSHQLGIVELTQHLIDRLETMTRTYTMRGDAEGAQQAQNAIALARASKIYLDALEAVGGENPLRPHATPEDDTPSQPPPETAPEPQRPPVLPTSPGVQVHPAGRLSPSSGGAFRLCQLLPTSTAGTAGFKVSATAHVRSRNQVTLRYPDARYTVDAVDTRVAVRTLSTVDDLASLNVVVEVFARSAGNEPVPVNFAVATLESLSSQPVQIEFPTLSHQLLIAPGRFGGVQRRVDRSLRFAGVLVSVFDADGEILYQAASERDLRSLAGGITRFNPDGTLNPDNGRD